MSSSLSKVETKIKSFEQAFVPDKESFVLPGLNSILLALDAHSWAIDSSRYSIEVTSEIALIQGSFVQVVCMAVTEDEFDESEKLVSEAVEFLKSKNVSCGGVCLIGSPSKTILRSRKVLLLQVLKSLKCSFYTFPNSSFCQAILS